MPPSLNQISDSVYRKFVKATPLGLDDIHERDIRSGVSSGFIVEEITDGISWLLLELMDFKASPFGGLTILKFVSAQLRKKMKLIHVNDNKFIKQSQ